MENGAILYTDTKNCLFKTSYRSNQTLLVYDVVRTYNGNGNVAIIYYNVTIIDLH